nr:uncharacterized protein LOC128694084 [Cherax quadricarinatus]
MKYKDKTKAYRDVQSYKHVIIDAIYIYTGAANSTNVTNSTAPRIDKEDITQGKVPNLNPVNVIPVKRSFMRLMTTVTIPSFCGLVFFIILCMCCTKSDSILCSICSSNPPK